MLKDNLEMLNFRLNQQQNISMTSLVTNDNTDGLKKEIQRLQDQMYREKNKIEEMISERDQLKL